LEVAIGLRREDCAKIKICNINFTDSSLTFYEKKKNIIRRVPLPPQLIRIVKQYVQTVPKTQEYLFKCGKSLYGGKTLYNKLQKLCELAGIPKRPVHALRSSCCKLHLSEGWQTNAVASLLNDLPSTIEQYYSCPSDAEIRELMEKSEVI
jgi:integrase